MGRSPGELRVRGAQAASAFAERRGWSEQSRLPDDAAFFQLLDTAQTARGALSAEALLEHFRARPCRFFAAFKNMEETRASLRRRFSSEAACLFERAERIVAGRFDLLGFRGLDFGSPVDWHLEPLARKRAPLVHWSRIDYLDASVAGDKKITWELNRQQHFMVLGRAYWRTGDERFAQTFVAHLESWMSQNPPKLGINWASSLEVSYRAISWLWALHFFKDSPHLTPQTFLRALKFLYLHARHLETYLSTYFSPNTHLTGEALGLFYLGTVWPEFRAASRWRDVGRRVLVDELARQVRPDGVYYEQATYYQRYTADIYTHFYTLARGVGASEVEGSGREEEATVREKLCAVLDFLMYVTRPDGTTPLFGDDDGGRLVWLDERAANDFRSTLQNGAALFRRPDYKFVAGGEASEETLWLTGSGGVERFDAVEAHPPADRSRAFADGGFYVMRDDWTREANYLLIDGGPHGALNCGHAHADALAFDAAARGRTLLVDPGTYTYTGSRQLRDLFRSSAAHNTLGIDGQSSSVPQGTFQWQHIAESTVRRWTSHARFDYFEGAHDGYMRLAAPATHARAVLFLKGDYWVVRDNVETSGAHTYDAYFHFAAGSDPLIEREEEMIVVREKRTGAAGLEIFAPTGDGKWRKEDGWVSEQYGARTSAPVCVRSTKAEGKREFTTFLVPCRAEQRDCPRRIFEISAVGGRAFIHERAVGSAPADRVRDLLLLGDARHVVSTPNFISDFAWTWARFAGDDTEPDELVLINGRQLTVNGEKIVRARGTTARVGYLWARRMGGEWQFEADAEVEFSPAAMSGAKQAFVSG